MAVVSYLYPGWEPNVVRSTAMAYLNAAELIYQNECQKDEWLTIHEWFVVHQLSFIAVEIFLKSFGSKEIYVDGFQDDDPIPDEIHNLYKGHEVKLEKLRDIDLEILKSHLNDDHYNMLLQIRDKIIANSEIQFRLNQYEQCLLTLSRV